MHEVKTKRAIIIGAGPAGLTAAYELVNKTDILPIVVEMTNEIGGISRTTKYKGNRIDIGGHRFFSKSKKVVEWWKNIMPIQTAPAIDEITLGKEYYKSNQFKCAEDLRKTPDVKSDPERSDKVMLVRRRLSRIFFLRRFFDYPITLSISTFRNLGLLRTAKIAVSYINCRLFPIKNEKSLADFFINRFGKELYLTFFKDYTEKVWGVPCTNIKPDWGAQRIKGVSITTVVKHALKWVFSGKGSINGKDTETSLIGQFLYPKFGPGQLWEEVAQKTMEKGCKLYLRYKAVSINIDKDRITSVVARNQDTGELLNLVGDYFISSMPVKDLISSLACDIPLKVRRISEGLVYRDFITVGLLLNRLKIKNETRNKTINGIIPDNWIYVQERDVKMGRIQVFNNWSPYLVSDQDKIWVGLEYFCNENDGFWKMSNDEIINFAAKELEKIGIINMDDVIDGVVIKVPKTYPAYFGTYDQFGQIRDFVDKIENLFLVGRNGMHRYNNMDHSMLSAMTAVSNISNGISSKDNIWLVNAEEEYHESK